MRGRAELARAEQNRKIRVYEAQARMDSAALNARAEIAATSHPSGFAAIVRDDARGHCFASTTDAELPFVALRVQHALHARTARRVTVRGSFAGAVRILVAHGAGRVAAAGYGVTRIPIRRSSALSNRGVFTGASIGMISIPTTTPALALTATPPAARHHQRQAANGKQPPRTSHQSCQLFHRDAVAQRDRAVNSPGIT